MTKSTSIKNIGKRKPEEWQAKLGTSALNPLEVMDLQEAVKAKKKTAVLQGRTFKIKYINGKYPEDDVIHYQPEEGFVPCGYIRVKKIMGEF